MSKAARTDKEYSREQRLVNENKKLKREISRLNKILARLDLDRYSTVKDILLEHEMSDKSEKTQDLLESLKEEWKCRECQTGYLEIIIFSKLGNLHYFRKCNCCNNRTKSQTYDPSKVRGIVKKS